MQQGKIKDVTFIPCGDSEVAIGICVDHPRTELIGHEVRTSRVVSKLPNGNFTTMNTEYEVVQE